MFRPGFVLNNGLWTVNKGWTAQAKTTVTWQDRILSSLARHEGRFGYTRAQLYGFYAAEFPDRRTTMVSISAACRTLLVNGSILAYRDGFTIPNHASTLREITIHYQNVGKASKNIKLHKKLNNHPNEDVIGIVDFGLPPDNLFAAKPGYSTCKYIF